MFESKTEKFEDEGELETGEWWIDLTWLDEGGMPEGAGGVGLGIENNEWCRGTEGNSVEVEWEGELDENKSWGRENGGRGMGVWCTGNLLGGAGERGRGSDGKRWQDVGGRKLDQVREKA